MFIEAIRLALEALQRNILRSLLTSLGVLIGVASVIAMLMIGRGASENVRAQIADLGSDVLTLATGQQKRGGRGASVNAKPFDYADVEAIRGEVRGLRYVAPLSTATERAGARNANWNVRVVGTENAYFKVRGWKLASGRFFDETEVYNGAGVCIIGDTVRRQLFGERDAVSEPMRIARVACRVIGVLAARGQSGAAEDDDNVVVVPFDMFQRRIKGAPDVDSIVMAAYREANIDRLRMKLEGLMRERRSLNANDPDDFSIIDMRQVAQAMTSATQTLTLFLAAIAAVSLVVGGIGIMNIMLVSVTERAHEIGVRLTIGALPSQIRLQFLCEAILLTMLGSCLGIVTGIGAAALAAPRMSIPFVLDPLLIAATVATASVIGIAFGYAPASKAAALDPAEALRQK